MKVKGVLKQDVRLNADGIIDTGGRLWLRGETVEIDKRHADLVGRRISRKRRKTANKQSMPPAATVVPDSGQ